ncbi:MAG: DUF4190 domain-containing protein [Tepidisphaeraceae bacterium]|jgi:hypothetical protein
MADGNVIPTGASAEPQKGNVFAIFGLLFGILGFIPFVSVLAFIFGIFGLRRTKTRGLGFKKTAIAGIVLGFLGTLTILPWEIYSLLEVRYQTGLVVSSYNLMDINAALGQYCKDNNGCYPPDLETLVKTERLNVGDFSMPLMLGASSLPSPQDQSVMTTDQKVQWVTQHSDVVYLGAGLKNGKWGLPPHTILLYEKHDQRSWPPNGSFWTYEVMMLDSGSTFEDVPAEIAHQRIAYQKLHPPS